MFDGIYSVSHSKEYSLGYVLCVSVFIQYCTARMCLAVFIQYCTARKLSLMLCVSVFVQDCKARDALLFEVMRVEEDTFH